MSSMSQFLGGGAIKAVQRGSFTMGQGNTTQNVTISAVNLSKTWCKATLRGSSTALSEHAITAALTSTTNLRVQRQGSSASTHDVEWEVIEYA